MDAELQALDAAMAAAAVRGLQITLLDGIDSLWTAIASDKMNGEPLVTGTGATRMDALLALTAELESRD